MLTPKYLIVVPSHFIEFCSVISSDGLNPKHNTSVFVKSNLYPENDPKSSNSKTRLLKERSGLD